MLRRMTLALIAAMLAAAFRPPAAHAHAQMFSVAVGRHGFENVPDYTLFVEAGHEVTLTFTYADMDLDDDNPHDIRIKGPGTEDLPTVRVSRDQPTATITFVPKKTGTLRLLCIIPCLGMENLVGGMLKVQRPRATGAPTVLSLDLTPRDDGSVLARIALQAEGEEPLADMPVTVLLRTSLGGDLVLANPTTMEDGSAAVKIPTSGAGTMRITAYFEGGNGLAYAEARGEISVPGAAVVHQPGALASPSAPPALALALLVVLGGVWATYAYVAYQLARIRRG